MPTCRHLARGAHWTGWFTFAKAKKQTGSEYRLRVLPHFEVCQDRACNASKLMQVRDRCGMVNRCISNRYLPTASSMITGSHGNRNRRQFAHGSRHKGFRKPARRTSPYEIGQAVAGVFILLLLGGWVGRGRSPPAVLAGRHLR